MDQCGCSAGLSLPLIGPHGAWTLNQESFETQYVRSPISYRSSLQTLRTDLPVGAPRSGPVAAMGSRRLRGPGERRMFEGLWGRFVDGGGT